MPKEEKKIGIEINIVANLLRREMDRRYREDSGEEETLSGVRWWLVHYLMQHEGEDVFQKDIEERFSVRRSTVSKGLKLMEQKGFIRRRPVEYDARLKKLELTPKTRALYVEAQRQEAQIEQLLRSAISPEEAEVFFGIMQKLKASLSQETGAEERKKEISNIPGGNGYDQTPAQKRPRV